MEQDWKKNLLSALGLQLPPPTPPVQLPPDRPNDPLVASMDFVKGLLGVKQEPGQTWSGAGALLGAVSPFVPLGRGFNAWHGTPAVFAPEVSVLRPSGQAVSLDLRDLQNVGLIPDAAQVAQTAKVGQALTPDLAQDVVQKVYPKGRFRLDKMSTGEGAQAFS